MSESNTKLKVGWNFDNSYARLPKLFFTEQKPIPVRSPELIILNEQLAASIGFDAEALRDPDSIEVFAGNSIPDGAFPVAQAYAGHQFGYFTKLGDGRAVLLGEHITPLKERLDIQLKGSGRTLYSRGGDGRAAIGPMLREYIISEAMYKLGIPTTRSLAVVTTGESIIREMKLPGAILTRVAASHIRVGTFQYVANWGSVDDIKVLADYTIERHFPEIKDSETPHLSLIEAVVKRQAALIAQWQLVGFVHGVMNTDNMTISGETIDYGPCAFMDRYNPKTVFSSIDAQGRYAYENQPRMAEWNLARFAETLLSLLHPDEKQAIHLAENATWKFTDLYEDHWLRGMRNKLGILDEEPEDEALIKKLLDMMHKYKADYTNTFRALTFDEYKHMNLFKTTEFSKWHKQWQERLERQGKDKASIQKLMMQSNPSVIPRNHRVEEALAAASMGDYSIMTKLLDVLSRPYDYTPDQEEYCKLPKSSTRPYRTFCGT